MGVELLRGDPRDNRPGRRIVIPDHPSQLAVVEVDLDGVRSSYLRHAIESLPEGTRLDEVDLEFLAAETRSSRAFVEERIDERHRKSG
jgi:hypothetical protein